MIRWRDNAELAALPTAIYGAVPAMAAIAYMLVWLAPERRIEPII